MGKNKSIKVNAILNLIKQSCTIMFPLITVPYVSRVLGAENYGLVSFVSTTVGYFILIAGLGISTYAIREGAKIREDKEKLNDFVNEIFSINIVSSSVAFILLGITVIFSYKLKSNMVLTLMHSSIIVLVMIGLDWINSIYEDYLYLTVRYILLHIMSIIFLFIFVKKSSDIYAYEIIFILSSYGGNLFNVFRIRKFIKIKLKFNKKMVKHLLPIFILFFNAVATTIYVNSDITILGIYKGDKEVGIYTLSSKIYAVGKQLLNAIIVVALPRLSAYVGRKELSLFNNLARKLFDALILFTIPLVTGLFVLGNTAIKIVGGNEYIEGGWSLRILSLAMIFAMIGTYYSSVVLIPFKQERSCLYISVLGAILNIITNIIFIPRIGLNGAALTTLISELVVGILYFMASKKFIRQNRSKNFILQIITASAFILIICLVINQLYPLQIIPAIVAIILSIFIYFITLLVMKNYLVIDLLQGVKFKK